MRRVVGRVVLTLIVVVSIVGAVVAGSAAFRTAVSSDGLLARLRAPEGSPARRGLIVERAYVTQSPDAQFGACLIRRKKTSESEFKRVAFYHDGTIVTLANGERLTIDRKVSVDAGFTEWFPREPTYLESSAILDRLRDDPPVGVDLSRGVISIGCLPPETELFVAGCVVTNGVLEACAGADGVLLSPTATVADWVSDIRFGASMAYAGMVTCAFVAIMLAWAILANKRVGLLAAHAQRKKESTRSSWMATPLLIALTLGAAASHMVVGTYVLALAPAAILCVTAIELTKRAIALKRAMGVLARASESRLTSMGADTREMAARIARDAVPATPLFKGHEYALVIAEIAGKDVVSPDVVAIEDDSSVGFLEVASSTFELPPGGSSEVTHENANAMLERMGSTARVPVRPNPPALPKASWKSLRAGDPILILGSIGSTLTPLASREGASGFREASGVPQLRAAEGKLVVLPLDARRLSKSLTRERVAVIAMVVTATLLACTAPVLLVSMTR